MPLVRNGWSQHQSDTYHKQQQLSCESVISPVAVGQPLSVQWLQPPSSSVGPAEDDSTSSDSDRGTVGPLTHPQFLNLLVSAPQLTLRGEEGRGGEGTSFNLAMKCTSMAHNAQFVVVLPSLPQPAAGNAVHLLATVPA